MQNQCNALNAMHSVQCNALNAVLPYIKGITEPLTRILKEHDIQVTSKPVKTLQQHFPFPKFRPAGDDQCNVIYKIPCASCPRNYIGEPKRSFTTRRKEHMRNIKYCTKGSNVAKHAWTFNHVIDFNNSKIIDEANNRSRETLESWHTAKTVGADNNSCRLPRQWLVCSITQSKINIITMTIELCMETPNDHISFNLGRGQSRDHLSQVNCQKKNHFT